MQPNMLLVDDEQAILLALREYFVGRGFVVDCANGTEEVRALPRDRQYAVLITDLRLDAARDEGLEVVQVVRERCPGCRAILLTAYSSPEVEAEARRAGVVVVEKPRALRDLARIVDELLDGPAAVPRARQPIAAGATARERDEALYRALVDSSLNALALVGSRGEWLYVSASATELLGYGVDEVVGRDCFEHVHPEDAAPARARLAAMVRDGGERIVGEVRSLHKDGRWVDLEATAVNRLGDPAIRAVVCSFREVGARKRAEREARFSRGLLASIVDATPDAIYAKDEAGRYILANASAARMAGRSAAEVAGKSDSDLYPPELAAACREGDAAVLAAGTVQTFEETARFPDGERTFLSTKGPLRDERGNVRGTFGISREITQRKLSEQQVRHAQRLEALGRLASGVAHDFNNLLGVIVGYGGLLQARLTEADPLRAPVLEICRAAERATGLTRQLLAFGRHSTLRVRALDLNRLVGETRRMLERLLGEDIELVARLAPDLGAVRADPGQLEQVVVNLAVNARDAMPRGGRLEIETANVELDEASSRSQPGLDPGRHVMLAVRDSGAGMSDEVKARVFEPFFTTKPAGSGTGLGLATVYGIVRQSGGRIAVWSEPGRGSEFKIYLPCVERQAEAAAPAVEAPAPRGSETLLLVEDDQALRRLTAEVLADHGYTVLEAASGPQALDLQAAHSGPLHAVLTDVVLPGVGGPALAEELARSRPGVKVIYVSGHSGDALRERGLLPVGAPVLEKPYATQCLLRLLREVLDGD